MSTALAALRRQVVSCERCPRLRTHCARVARQKRAAYRHEAYWGRPVPGFGDPRARILIVGLAPGAHGANRTGRLFTGDRAGDVLMRSLHAAGLASQPRSTHARDGLTLAGAYITAVVRCAPPGNAPAAAEIANCQPYLQTELIVLRAVSVVVVLGRTAFTAYWRLLAARGLGPRPRPRFTHGLVARIDGAPTLVASYHPSQQNTYTGRLTQPMLDAVFTEATRLADASHRPHAGAARLG